MDQASIARRNGTRLSALVVLFTILLGGTLVPAAAAPNATHIYLIRGFMNVFSLGLDDFANTLQRNGYRAEVYNHMLADLAVADAAAAYRSGRIRHIVLIGHSMGAGAVVRMVEDLANLDVPVSLAVTLDTAPITVNGGKVEHFVHMYISTGIGGPLTAGPRFQGRISNVDLARYPQVGHMTIDKDSLVHSMLLGYIARATGDTLLKPAAAPNGRPQARGAAATPGPRAGAGKPTRPPTSSSAQTGSARLNGERR